MILDRWEEFQEKDPGNMLAEIEHLPEQLKKAWSLGQDMPLQESRRIRNVVLAGMGGSAIGADLLQAYALSHVPIPIIVWRNYALPAFVGKESLVILSSHSGNTEETLSAFDHALETGAKLIAVTTGGELAVRAKDAGVPLWQFEHVGQPRAAVGYSFGLLLAAISHMGWLPDPVEEVADAVASMKDQQVALGADVPIAQNAAKRVAGQLVGRWPTFIGADFLAPVARRWRTQVSEIAKAVAQFEELPEADHNLVAGVPYPEELIPKMMVIFLKASHYHPRNQLRIDVTREVLMVEGFNTDLFQAQGKSRLAQQWTTLHFGDYVSYYLAMSYGVDPSPVPAIEELKRRIKDLTEGKS
ncbi:MAG: bifunctional phosphoglucose/phosphomannose isomerase [Chloroflexi bacterium RBG_16_48_8]|nr:MAG: bifunctional phosphoglucose/phosphomannose isomerase [Chloroflexi bacterium RBG_16_48_8]